MDHENIVQQTNKTEFFIKQRKTIQTFSEKSFGSQKCCTKSLKCIKTENQTPLDVNKRISTLLWFPFEVAYFMHIFLFRAPFFAQLKQRFYVFPLAIFQIRSHTCSYEIVSVYSRGCSFGKDLLVLFSPNWF